jgi:hypothetical protein
VQLAHGRLHQALACTIELAVAAHLGRPMLALVSSRELLKRSAWRTRAAVTRSRTALDGSLWRSADSLS